MSDQLDLGFFISARAEYNQNFPLEDLPGEIISPEPTPEFVKDVRLRGIITPIRINIFPDGKVLILSGNRRVKAARIAGLNTIPAIIYREKNLDESLRASISAENSRRSPNPIASLEIIKHYVGLGYDEKEIATICGMSVLEARKIYKLTNLAEPLKVALASGKMKPSAAFLAADLSPERQKSLVENLKRKGKITVSDVMKARSARSHDELATLFADIPEMPSAPAQSDQYVILNGTAMPEVFTDLGQAQMQAIKLGPGYKVYKLVQI